MLLGTALTLPMEGVRLAVALAGCAIGAYYDLFNNKNVPNTFLYAFLAIAFVLNLAAYHPQVTYYAIGTALVLFAATWLLYKTGQLGGADVFVLSSIALLLPVQPLSLLRVGLPPLPSLPFILSVLVASGLSFMIYMLVRSLPVAVNALRRPNSIPGSAWVGAAAILAAYALMAFALPQIALMGRTYFLFITFVVAGTVYFTLFKSAINESMAEWVPLTNVEEEDVLAIEQIDASAVKKYGLARLVDAPMRARLKAFRGKLPVYKKLPPFIPHLLIGLAASVLFGNVILLVAGLAY